MIALSPHTSCYSKFHAIPRNTALNLSYSPLGTCMWNLPRHGHVLTSAITIPSATWTLCCIAAMFLHTLHVIIVVICLGSHGAPRIPASSFYFPIVRPLEATRYLENGVLGWCTSFFKDRSVLPIKHTRRSSMIKNSVPQIFDVRLQEC